MRTRWFECEGNPNQKTTTTFAVLEGRETIINSKCPVRPKNITAVEQDMCTPWKQENLDTLGNKQQQKNDGGFP